MDIARYPDSLEDLGRKIFLKYKNVKMKNFHLLTFLLYIIGCGQKSDPATVFGVAPMISANQADTTYNANGETIITVYKKVINVKCDTTTITDSAVSLRKYIPPATIPPVITTRKNIINYWDYESSNYAPWKFTQLGTKSKPSTLHARAGKQSMRFELNKTDPDQAASKRTEFNLAPETSNPVERWYGISYYVDAPYPADPSCPEIWFQWHHNGDGPPPLALWSYGTTFGINQRVSSTAKEVYTKLGSITTGKWMDFVWHIKWSSGSDGLIEVWMNGTKLLTKLGANNWAGSAGKNYLKTGIYKWGWKNGYKSTVTQRILFVDEERVGNEKATYNDVAP
jgi:hypothetical protein